MLHTRHRRGVEPHSTVQSVERQLGHHFETRIVFLLGLVLDLEEAIDVVLPQLRRRLGEMMNFVGVQKGVPHTHSQLHFLGHPSAHFFLARIDHLSGRRSVGQHRKVGIVRRPNLTLDQTERVLQAGHLRISLVIDDGVTDRVGVLRISEDTRVHRHYIHIMDLLWAFALPVQKGRACVASKISVSGNQGFQVVQFIGVDLHFPTIELTFPNGDEFVHFRRFADGLVLFFGIGQQVAIPHRYFLLLPFVGYKFSETTRDRLIQIGMTRTSVVEVAMELIHCGVLMIVPIHFQMPS
mmetsp:Transcript_43294/g.74952  ORF Transcript_43294/g.74952 Transcript_43294/m.74952 type:complete len:295 (-) Transcript_43294:2374-3258(-)